MSEFAGLKNIYMSQHNKNAYSWEGGKGYDNDHSFVLPGNARIQVYFGNSVKL